MNDLTPFTDGEFKLAIRLYDPDGFRVHAPGLARALGFREAHDLLRNIPGEEKGSEIVRTPGGDQQVGFVTEAGFYRALGQRQPSRIADPVVRDAVERFQSWIYREVLPALRNTGRYSVVTLGRRELAEMVIAEADRADKAEQRAGIAEATVLELHPKAQSWDVLADTGADYSVREAGYILNRDPAIDTGQKRLFALLREWRVIDRRDKPYANHSAHVVLRPQTRVAGDGERVQAKPQVRITVAGLSYLHKRLGGVEPLDFSEEAS